MSTIVTQCAPIGPLTAHSARSLLRSPRRRRDQEVSSVCNTREQTADVWNGGAIWRDSEAVTKPGNDQRTGRQRREAELKIVSRLRIAIKVNNPPPPSEWVTSNKNKANFVHSGTNHHELSLKHALLHLCRVNADKTKHVDIQDKGCSLLQTACYYYTCNWMHFCKAG